MPSFRYQSLTAAGEVRQGMVAAATRAAAIRTLGGRGETATQLDAVDADDASAGAVAAVALPDAAAGAPRGTLSRPLRRGRGRPVASRSEMANLVRELATALEAGLPVMQALRTVRRQTSGRAMTAILDHLIDRVEAGAPLHQAAGEYGPPFDDLIVGMLRAADASGKTTDVLHQLADLLERSLELRREVIGSTLYPMIVAVLVLGSAIILVTVLVPRGWAGPQTACTWTGSSYGRRWWGACSATSRSRGSPAPWAPSSRPESPSSMPCASPGTRSATRR
jgi:type II secretory pathway component PulF